MKTLLSILRNLLGSKGQFAPLDPIAVASMAARWIFIFLLALTITGVLFQLVGP